VSDLYPSESAPDRVRRFGGLNRLYGPQAIELLGRAHVCVVGIGGVGSWAAEALARSGVGRLTLIDPDHVAESNINRQVQALEETLGKAKVRAMAERIGGIHPQCRVVGIEEFVSAENVAALLGGGFDFVLDAIDDARAKTALIVRCRAQGLPLICVGGAGGRTDPTQVRVADLARTSQDPLLAKVRAGLRREHGFPRDLKQKFGVECVYSEEPIRYPEAVGGACYERPEDGRLHGLNCAGFGSSVCVTAAFGLAAVARVLDHLVRVEEGRAG